MLFIFIALFVGWKVIKRTRWLRGSETDLVSDLQEYNDYTEDFNQREADKPSTLWGRISNKLF